MNTLRVVRVMRFESAFMEARGDLRSEGSLEVYGCSRCNMQKPAACMYMQINRSHENSFDKTEQNA